MSLFAKVKRIIQSVFWPVGTAALIRRGYLKGYKFQVSENSGWSPILGRWEPECQKVFSAVIAKGATVFDLGANNGIHSLLFSKLVGENGKVVAFEPLEDNVKEIEKNCSLNNISNIQIVRAAVGKENGMLTFHLGLHSKQGSLLGIGRESGKELKVKVVTLDSFISEHKLKPDFLKIDIEGAESDALMGFSGTISSIQPMLFIELHNPEQDKKVGAFLKEHSYLAFRLNERVKDTNLRIPYLEQIKEFNQVYPHPDGIWGTILAVPHSKFSSILKI